MNCLQFKQYNSPEAVEDAFTMLGINVPTFAKAGSTKFGKLVE